MKYRITTETDCSFAYTHVAVVLLISFHVSLHPIVNSVNISSSAVKQTSEILRKINPSRFVEILVNRSDLPAINVATAFAILKFL